MTKSPSTIATARLSRFSRASDDYVCTLETECQCSPRMRPQCEFALPKYPDRVAAERAAGRADTAKPRSQARVSGPARAPEHTSTTAEAVAHATNVALLVLLGLAAAGILVLLLLY